jgi:hypothetical protein
MIVPIGVKSMGTHKCNFGDKKPAQDVDTILLNPFAAENGEKSEIWSLRSSPYKIWSGVMPERMSV